MTSMSSDSRLESPPAISSGDQQIYSHCRDETEYDSDCSEVLSVGSEPSLAIAKLDPKSNLEASRSPSPSSDASGSHVIKRCISSSTSPVSVAGTFPPCQVYPLQEDCNSSSYLNSTQLIPVSDGCVESKSCGLSPLSIGPAISYSVNVHSGSVGSPRPTMIALSGLHTSASFLRSMTNSLTKQPFHCVIDQLQEVVKHVDSMPHQQERQQRENQQMYRQSRDRLLGRTLDGKSSELSAGKCSDSEILRKIFPKDNFKLTQNNLEQSKIGESDSVCDDENNDSENDHDRSIQYQNSLKFSIDNILKADFGRRITDPMALKRSRLKKHTIRPMNLSMDLIECSTETSRDESIDSVRNISPRSPTSSLVPSTSSTPGSEPKLMQWPAWVYCTRYSDRPSSGRSPRARRPKRAARGISAATSEEKRPRTAFSAEQLARLKQEFTENKYLNEQRRQSLSKELGLNEAQIKIWFQNKRAKIKKASGQKNPLALQLMAQGLYNHSTVPLSKEEIEQAEKAERQIN